MITNGLDRLSIVLMVTSGMAIMHMLSKGMDLLEGVNIIAGVVFIIGCCGYIGTGISRGME